MQIGATLAQLEQRRQAAQEKLDSERARAAASRTELAEMEARFEEGKKFHEARAAAHARTSWLGREEGEFGLAVERS